MGWLDTLLNGDLGGDTSELPSALGELLASGGDVGGGGQMFLDSVTGQLLDQSQVDQLESMIGQGINPGTGEIDDLGTVSGGPTGTSLSDRLRSGLPGGGTAANSGAAPFTGLTASPAGEGALSGLLRGLGQGVAGLSSGLAGGGSLNLANQNIGSPTIPAVNTPQLGMPTRLPSDPGLSIKDLPALKLSPAQPSPPPQIQPPPQIGGANLAGQPQLTGLQRLLAESRG